MIKKILFFFFCFVIVFYNISFCYNKVLIEKSNNYPSANKIRLSASNLKPNTYSKNIIAIDRKSLNVLYEKNAYSKVAMASTTKIMTCILAIENCKLSDNVLISKNSSKATGSRLGLKEKSEITMNDLLYGLMLRSGNDCAIAIAEHISGTVENFIKLMNNKALELELNNTHFATPHGLDDENHYTTAYDLSILTNYALNNPTFKKIVATKNYNIVLNNNSTNITNTNELLGIEGIYGVKTGFTFNAGRCLVTSYKINDFDIIIVVLGANTKKIRGQDTLNLIKYITSNYIYINISDTVQEIFDNYNKNFLNTIYLEKTNDKPIIKLDSNYPKFIPIQTNEKNLLEAKIYMPNKLSYTINIDKPIGKLYLYNNNSLILDINIYLEKKLRKNTWKYYFKKIFSYIS